MLELKYSTDYNFSGLDILKYRICDNGVPCETRCGEANLYISVLPENIVSVEELYEDSKVELGIICF